MRQIPRSVMMFAAGFGTRMGALTADCPKPLIQVCGVPLIDHTLGLVRMVEPERIVANLHYLPEQLRTHLADTDVRMSHETPDILDTGGGLRHALPLLGEGPVMTTNTDAIWSGPNPFEMALDHWDPDKMDGLLVCVPRAQTLGHAGKGDFHLSQTGQITRGLDVIYGGVQILKTEGLADIPDQSFSLNLLWDQMIRDKRLFGVSYPGKWCDVGNPDGLRLAESLLKESHV
ncbi:nucleotidyltransferase family protein [Shimia aestuarii]|nr:nucleotidyltransferase family protein [Shimia aestuarii]